MTVVECYVSGRHFVDGLPMPKLIPSRTIDLMTTGFAVNCAYTSKLAPVNNFLKSMCHSYAQCYINKQLKRYAAYVSGFMAFAFLKSSN